MFLRKIYKSGKIKVISDGELTQNQVERIMDIINNFYYARSYHISKTIFHEMEEEFGSIVGVKTKRTRSGILKVKLYTK